MATSTVQPAQALDETMRHMDREMVPGLLWGAFMLFVLGLWLAIKHEDLSRIVVWVVWLMAVISFACAIWQIITRSKLDWTAERRQAALARQGKLVALLLSAGGVLLLGLAVYLGDVFKLAAFGEVVGMCLLGIISLVSGRSLLRREKSADAPVFLDLLSRRHQRLGILALVVGAGLVLGILAVIFLVKPQQEYFFALGGTLLFGFLLAGAGMWLLAQESIGLTRARMRVFVLVSGGLLGLIVSLCALAQAVVWREEVFGGMRAWQGERSWHLWLCAYAELLGLALMFTSLLLARTDIRSNPVLRRALYGYNAVLTGLLLLAMLVVLNIVLYAMFPGSFLWSKSRGAHTLSASSKALLTNLRESASIYVLMPRDYVSAELRNFLENCEAQSGKVRVKYVSPFNDFEEYENLAKRFPGSLSGRVSAKGGIADRGLLLVYGELPADTAAKVPHAFISYERLVDRQPVETKEEAKTVLVFKGESEVMNELSFLAQDRRKLKVYVLQGDAELDINEMKDRERRDPRVELQPLGAGRLMERLKKGQFDVEGLTFGQELPKDKTPNLVYAKETGPEKRKEIPTDAEALVIAGPSVPLRQDAIEALERYMDRGGKLLVYLDIVVDSKTNALKTTGLEDFLRKYGVLVGTEFPMRVPQAATDDPRVVIATVPKDSSSELARNFSGDDFLTMSTARIIKPDPSSQKYKGEVILHLDPHDAKLRQLYWEETAVSALSSPLAHVKELAQSGTLQVRLSSTPIPVAVAVSEKLFDPGSTKENLKPRLVVFGDAEMVSNVGMLEGQTENDLPYSWTASALNWLAVKKLGLTGPQTKETTSYSLNPLKVNVQRMAYLPGWLMMLSIVSLGAGIWVVRRR